MILGFEGATARAVTLPEPCQEYAGAALSTGNAMTNARTNRSARMRPIRFPRTGLYHIDRNELCLKRIGTPVRARNNHVRPDTPKCAYRPPAMRWLDERAGTRVLE